MSDLLPVTVPPLPALAPVAELLAAFLSRCSPQTRRAYAADLRDFAAFRQLPIELAAGQLLADGPGSANLQALHYRAHLIERGLAAATVNRRLAALRSLVQLGRVLGRIGWELCCPGLKAEAYRDTRGPGRSGMRKLIDQADARTDRKGVRDRAILALLYDLALRRAEVCALNIGDVDLAGERVAVLGKGRTAREWLTLPPETAAAIATWLALRGQQLPDAPLFVTLGRGMDTSRRLTGDGLYYLVRRLGDKAGVRCRPHHLRHSGITRALDLVKGDVRKVQRYSRHKDLRVLNRYDDSRQDFQGEIARMVARDKAD